MKLILSTGGHDYMPDIDDRVKLIYEGRRGYA